jgi:Protein kinase domain
MAPMSSDETLIRSVTPAGTPAIPGMVLNAVLGRGGMAVVYEGFDQGFSPPRRVAVKLMSEEISADPEFRARFAHEASLVAGFRHDNIVQVYASGELSGTRYIIMEYLPGGTLGERIARNGPLPPLEAARVGAQLADALAYAHQRDIVHRDFKPGNVLFTADGKPVLSDFGVAKSVQAGDAGLTRHSAVIGAPRYMAPEQERGEAVSDRADIYSFGLTLYEMFTASPPPTRERVLHTPEGGAGIKEKLASVSPALAPLVCLCLLSDPERRPSARECAEVLSATTLARVSPSTDAPRPRVSWVAAGAVLVVIGAAGSITFLRQGSPSQEAQALKAAAAPAAAERSAPSVSGGAAAAAAEGPASASVAAQPSAATSAGTTVATGAGSRNEIGESCGPGIPQSLLAAAVSEGLRAKVRLTLAADSTAQNEAESTLQHDVVCLTALARAGFTSPDADHLLQDADGLLKHSGR